MKEKEEKTKLQQLTAVKNKNGVEKKKRVG